MKIIKVMSLNNEEILINQEQVCSIVRSDNESDIVSLHMTNGEIIETVSPKWENWEADLYSDS